MPGAPFCAKPSFNYCRMAQLFRLSRFRSPVATRSLSDSALADALAGRAPGGLKGNGVVGVRRETKNRWERRAPLTPSHVRTLSRKGVVVLVQPSRMRVFTDDEYERAGAFITEDLRPASVIVGVKEIPIEAIIPERT
jgi:hypothetical protein